MKNVARRLDLTRFTRIRREITLEARLAVVYSREVLRVLRKFAPQKRLADLDYFATEMFHETNSQKDGTIRRETRFPDRPEDWVLSGPHFFVGTPLNKTPNEGCSTKGDYSSIDLTEVSDDYLPRANYTRACSPQEYLDRVPKWRGKPTTQFCRHVHREMMRTEAERSLAGAIMPPGPTHVNTVFSVVLEIRQLLLFAAMCASLPADFFVRSTGKGHINDTLIGLTAFPDSPYEELQVARALRLNCLTVFYGDLWNEGFLSAMVDDRFTGADQRLGPWSSLTSSWSRESALRSNFERRQALLELDALAALALGLTLDELLTIYHIQFPVLQNYEHENRYDQSGRLVPGEVLKIAKQEGIDINQPGPGICWTDPKLVPIKEREYAPPFTRHDRELDMAQAYQEFERRMRESKAA